MKIMEIKQPQMNPNDILAFQKDHNEETRQADLRRLKGFDQFIGKILEQVHYIGKLKDEQKIAEVENIQQRIDKAARKLNDYMNRPENAPEDINFRQQASGPSGDNIPIEKHPLLPDMGGMPMELDNLDSDFLTELGVNPTLDRTEIQNQIKKKLEDKLKLLNKMKAEFKAKAKIQPAYKPVQKQVNELVIKYKMALDDMKKKPVLEEELKYQPRPSWTPPVPRPPGA